MLRVQSSLNVCKGIQRVLIPYAANLKQHDLFCTTTTTSQYEKKTGILDVNGNNTDDKKHSNKSRTTYDEAEVHKFRSLADSWWDLQGDCKALHTLNKLRIALVRDGLLHSPISTRDYKDGPKPLKGLQILDVGCGGGIVCEPLARLGASVTGVDAAEESVNAARLHADQDPSIKDNVVYIHGTIEQHVQENACKYDAVVASEVLEHVDDTELFIYTCGEAIKPGGSLFLTTINKTMCSWVGAIIIAEYMLHLLPRGTHDWNKFIPLQDLRLLLEKGGFVTRTVHGMTYNPLINEWFWISNTSINYAVHAIKESC